MIITGIAHHYLLLFTPANAVTKKMRDTHLTMGRRGKRHPRIIVARETKVLIAERHSAVGR